MTIETSFKSIRPGRDALPTGYRLPRHRHLRPYAIVVIAGGFEQTSYAGRTTVHTGDILIEPTLDCHANSLLPGGGAQILRLSWPHVETFGAVYRLKDMDALVRCAERDLHEATAMARAEIVGAVSTSPSMTDWPDKLALDIREGALASVSAWADKNDLAAETVSRGFARAYGVSPIRFRQELRVRSAWLRIVGSCDSLANIAVTSGFSDQAHMTRSVARFTGAPPSAWRGFLL